MTKPIKTSLAVVTPGFIGMRFMASFDVFGNLLIVDKANGRVMHIEEDTKIMMQWIASLKASEEEYEEQ